MPVAELTLPGEARSASLARRFLVATLADWGIPNDDAALLVTELVTNAALHARTEVVVRIEQRPACLRLGVTDGSPRRPVVRNYSATSTTGRGLALVSALASRWGITSNDDGTKTVWVELAGTDHQGRDGPGRNRVPGAGALRAAEVPATDAGPAGTLLRAV